MEQAYVIGLDYGSDSVRAILLNALTGEQLGDEVHNYTRWKKGLYCDPQKNQFRQHPLDYIEGLKIVIKNVLKGHENIAPHIKAIALDTTASTPCLADRNLQPLSLHDKYKDNPDAMFVLWKDHTGEKEAEEIEALCHTWPVDFTRISGGHYSAENYWSKVLHLLRSSEELRRDAYTVVEECDWIPALLTGNTDPEKAKIGHCGAAQKMFWNEEWGGFPPEEFFSKLDPVILPVLRTMRANRYTADKPYGTISKQWASEFGLPETVIVGTGNIDSHQGAIGAGITYGTSVINLGTSACMMAVMPPEDMADRVVEGVFGQAESIILPGYVGFEIGLSSFGDVFAWLKRTLTYAADRILGESVPSSEIDDRIMQVLTEDAERLPLRQDAPFATDWFNGRRCPELNPKMWGSLMGLRISTSAPELYYALVESTAFAIRRLCECLNDGGVVIDRVIGVGGISQKSPFVMQMLADVTGKDIHVSACRQSCAMGSAICASVVGGVYRTIEEAQKALCMPIIKVYHPRTELKEHFEKRFKLYHSTDLFTQSLI